MQQVCDCYRDVDVYMFCSVYSVNLLFQLFLLPQEGWRGRGGRNTGKVGKKVWRCVMPQVWMHDVIHMDGSCRSRE